MVTDGYITLPSGLFLQWGIADGTKRLTFLPVTFHIPFATNTIPVIMMTENRESTGGTGYLGIIIAQISNKGFSWRYDTDCEAGHWMAIGQKG